MPEVLIESTRLIFNCKNITPDVYTLIPRLRVDLEVFYYKLAPEQPDYSMIINFGNSELRIIAERGESFYVSMLVPERSFFMLLPNSSISPRLYIDLDHYRLAQIEKIRGGRDLQVRIDIFFVAELQQQPPARYPGTVSLDVRIPKSDWVEVILP